MAKVINYGKRVYVNAVALWTEKFITVRDEGKRISPAKHGADHTFREN